MSTRLGLEGNVCEYQTWFRRDGVWVTNIFWKGKYVSTRRGVEGKVCESQTWLGRAGV